MNPKDAIQDGAHVLYKPQGLYALVVGFDWAESAGGKPEILAYRLSIGISVPRDDLDLICQPKRFD